MTDGHPSLFHRRGRQRRKPDDVPRRVDVPHTRSAAAVDPHVTIIEADADVLEPEPGDGSATSCCDEQHLAMDATVLEDQLDLTGTASSFHHPRAEPQFDTFTGQDPLHGRAGLRIVVRQQVVEHLHDRYLAAEALKRLGELEADRAAAEHDQPSRQLGELEDGAVRHVRNVCEAG